MNTLYIGIDWSETKHDVCILNERGAILKEFIITQSMSGHRKLQQEIKAFDKDSESCLIGLETSSNLLIDFLEPKPYQSYVIPPNKVASSRGRFSGSGRRNDRSDAHLIAAMLRTDTGRFTPWQADGILTHQMRASLRLIDDLTQSITRYSNRLRTALLRAYPAAVELFSDITTQIDLRFLINFPSQTAAQALSYTDFEAFCRSHRYSHPKRITDRYAHLQKEHSGPILSTELAYQEPISVWAALLLQLVQKKRQAILQVHRLFLTHPDAYIFESLPGAGELLGPKLLVMFGDHRERFPSASAIQALAGAAPVTIQSGKKNSIRFRRACNHEYRHTAQLFALQSVQQCSWAATYFANAKARGMKESHTYRCLAKKPAL